jgi:hypothetical protein
MMKLLVSVHDADLYKQLQLPVDFSEQAFPWGAAYVVVRLRKAKD